jgi:hypothetical protein
MLRGLDESKNDYAFVPSSLRLSFFFLRKWSDKNISNIPIPNMYYFENNHIYRWHTNVYDRILITSTVI